MFKNEDTKLKILKFNYSWVDAVEEEERRTEKEQQQKRQMKKKLEKEISEEKKDGNANGNRIKIMDYSAILDFGDHPVTDVDTKLKILKFDYSWVDAVEEEERRIEEEQQQKREMKKKLEKEIAEEKKDGNANDNRYKTPLDFGDEAVKNWETKLQILKFDYQRADQVEEEEKAKNQETKAAKERVKMEENKIKDSIIGGKNQTIANSPRARLKAYMIMREREQAKASVEKQNIKKEETAKRINKVVEKEVGENKSGGKDGKEKVVGNDRKNQAIAKSPRAKLSAFIRKRKERELAKASLEKENIKKVETVERKDKVVYIGDRENKIGVKEDGTAKENEKDEVGEKTMDKKITSLQDEHYCNDIPKLVEAMELEVNKGQKIAFTDDNSYGNDDDNGDDDDRLFGPRKLFFFGIDFFKDAGKSVW
ncbi:tropomyosin, muscle-like [Saccostrea cucullata]|uniref:tropomyosin, muscle-like n=1 Tax=Saccostrea cuccullata TaxID=36930 RepID=UPI002ED08772